MDYPLDEGIRGGSFRSKRKGLYVRMISGAVSNQREGSRRVVLKRIFWVWVEKGTWRGHLLKTDDGELGIQMVGWKYDIVGRVIMTATR